MSICENRKKILIVTTSLGIGGAERFVSNLSKLLTVLEYQVHIVTFQNVIDIDYTGTLFNLGLEKDKNDSFFGKINRFFILRRYVKNNKFDFIIDNRTRTKTLTEILLAFFVYELNKCIYLIHNFKVDLYLPSNKCVAVRLYKSIKCFISVSEKACVEFKKKFNYNNVLTIYNPIDLAKIHELSDIYEVQEEKYILFYGRLSDGSKNLKLLIESFEISKIYEKGIKLIVMGDGEDADYLNELIVRSNVVNHVKIINKQNNPFPYVKNALFTVLTSRFEGFPTVLTESLALSTPVVTVDCLSGPSELIINQYNGLIVENYKPYLLAEAYNLMVDDEQLYFNCKKNALKSISHFSIDSIANEWKEILNG